MISSQYTHTGYHIGPMQTIILMVPVENEVRRDLMSTSHG